MVDVEDELWELEERNFIRPQAVNIFQMIV